jgi:hypothetical protein
MLSWLFASSHIKTLSIFWLILAPFEHFIKSSPFKAPELVMYACFGLIHLPHTELMQSETPRQLSQRRVRLHINWFHAKWDSTSTESTQKAQTFTMISLLRVDSVDVESHLALTQSIISLTLRWLSWWGMRLRINWVTAECLKIKISWRIQEQNRKHSKPYYLAYIQCVWLVQKTRIKKSHASVPLRWCRFLCNIMIW